MSTIFRLKYKLGLIPSAKKIDADWAELIKVRDELNSIENSAELKRYNELNILTASYDFQLQKKEINNLNFKDSQERSLLEELEKLKNNKSIKEYFKILKSGKPERLRRIESSTELKLFLELKEEMKSFDTKKARKKSPSFAEFERLRKNNDIIFYQKFINSSAWQNFSNIERSYELERLNELKRITAEPQFIEQVAYLRNKKRYEGTEFFRQEKELKALDESKLMKRYRQLKKSSKLDFFKQWKIIFEEQFTGKQLDKDRWQTENYWGYKLNGKSFSQADEAQCFNGDHNVQIYGNTLAIMTKAEKIKGQTWNASVGLMPKEFNYSSGIINTGESFRFREGVVEAKVKFSASESLTNAFSLTGSMPMPQIDVFRSGKNCVGIGYTEMTQNGISQKYKQVYGLDFDQYHIFRLEKFDHTIVWKINGEAVHSEYYTGAETDLFLNFVTSLHEPVNKGLIPHNFHIDWVRCFAKSN